MKRTLLATILLLLTLPASADRIAVIGTGDVGSALGPAFAAQGHTVVYGSRDPDRDSIRELVARTGSDASAATQADAVIDADIVVLAVPGMLVEEITLGLGDLSGKIVIDPTNPLVREGELFGHGVDTSNAEIIQAAAPDAHVVKAFNTLSCRTMVDPDSSGGPVSIPLAGDSDDAKARVAELVEGMGLEPIDAGPLSHARWVEGMLIVWINNRYGGGESFDFHLRKN
ncbi:MAG: NADPH-dependent F420 reductase [Woeseiaceae bacterium]|nr:NADPH-dependent F420 reductase [Woeseiaceae bacterium]